MLALILGVVVWTYALLDFPTSAPWSPARGAALGLSLVILGVCIYALVRFAPQPLGLQVGEQGIRLEYPRGRTVVLSWAHPRLRLEHTLGSADSTSRGSASYWMEGFSPVRNFLTEGAFEGILRMARSRGLDVYERPARQPGWMRTEIFRGPR